jgi:hypothetical protein
LRREVREVARRLCLKQRWDLIVARDSRSQQIELRLIADLSGERGLTQRLFGLGERRVRDVDKPIGERRVVIRRRNVELELRALCRDFDVRGATSRGCRGVLRRGASAGERGCRTRSGRADTDSASRSRPS